MLHGRSVAYAEAGSGSVLLMIHGFARTLENWQEVIEPLAKDHTVIAPDLPGHGASAPGGGDYSLGGLRLAYATCSSRSVMTVPRWSATRSGAASLCSSPTSSLR
jgi:pimeloyl-ACP methyl ester carboxylesterase